MLIISGWWYTYPSEKYEFVSWDDYSQYMESHKIPWFQTTNQLIISFDRLPTGRCGHQAAEYSGHKHVIQRPVRHFGGNPILGVA